MNSKASRYITGSNQAINLVNFDLSRLGALTKVPGSTQLIGATLSGRIGGFYEFEQLSGASYVMTGANTNLYKIVGNSFNSVRAGLTDSGIFSFVTFVDRLFATNGSEFFKFDGVNSSLYSLPPGATPTSLTPAGVGGLSGNLAYAYGYLNDRGYFGPAVNPLTISVAGVASITVNGLTSLLDYGITSIIMYRGFSGGPYFRIGSALPSATSFIDSNLDLGVEVAPEFLWFTMAPQAMDIFNNQLMLVGFSAAPSTFYFSEVGEPEGVLPESFIEVRTNDGDKLTVGKTYYSQFVLCKTRSIHALSGDDPSNFSVREISDQYGCISKRAIAVYEQRCWFLDEKGVCEFDGANVSIVSNPVEDTFKSMNIPVAERLAQMIHVKDRNEVWTAIPTDGASFINTIVVYDYLAKGWYIRNGVAPCSLGVFGGGFTRRAIGFGDFSGTINYFGSSLFSDNGRGITCVVRFPYNSAEQHSTEKVYRRLWLDLDPQLGGVTHTISVNLYANQSDTPSVTTTIVQNSFQNRIDYGVSCKDLAPEFIFSGDGPLRLNGYTLAHRFQRDV